MPGQTNVQVQVWGYTSPSDGKVYYFNPTTLQTAQETYSGSTEFGIGRKSNGAFVVSHKSRGALGLSDIIFPTSTIDDMPTQTWSGGDIDMDDGAVLNVPVNLPDALGYVLNH